MVGKIMTVLVDSNAAEYFLDDELIPDLRDRLMNPTRLNVLEVIITAGDREMLGALTGTMHGSITDQGGKPHRAHFPRTIVPGLGRRTFSSSTAVERGITITTTLEAGDPHLRKGNIVVQLGQQHWDRGLCAVKVDLQ